MIDNDLNEHCVKILKHLVDLENKAATEQPNAHEIATAVGITNAKAGVEIAYLAARNCIAIRPIKYKLSTCSILPEGTRRLINLGVEV